MDLDPRNPVLSFTYYCQGRGVEELRQILLYANVELQNARLEAQEEIRKRDDELRHFRNILSKAVKERDEAQDKLQKLLVEKLSYKTPEQQELKQVLVAPVASGVTSTEHELKNSGFSSSEGDESIVSSPVIDPPLPPPSQAQLKMSCSESFHGEMMEKRPLPEKGKLLDAVMTAGPLLQTLLLAGPLPQWRHPPPPLESSQIPPVAIPSPSPPPPPPPQSLPPRDALPSIADYSRVNECGRLSRKRSSMDGAASSAKTKSQRILLN